MKKSGSLLLSSAVKCISAYAANYLNNSGSPKDAKSVTAGILFGLIDSISGNKASEQLNELVVYNDLRSKFNNANLNDINHDLQRLFKETAILSVEFVKKMYIEEQKKEAEEYDKTGRKAIKNYNHEIKNFLKERKNDVNELAENYEFTENDIIESDNIVDKLVKELFEGDPDENHLKIFYTRNLPFVFNLIFTELLKYNDHGFKAFQIWILKDILQLINSSLAASNEIKNSIARINSGIPAITFDTVDEIVNGYADTIITQISLLEVVINKQGDREQALIKASSRREAELMKELRQLMKVLTKEKSEKEEQRKYFLQNNDALLKEVAELKNKYEQSADEEISQDSVTYQLLKNKLIEQIIANENAQKANEALLIKNDLEIRVIESKYNKEIEKLAFEITELKIEVNLIEESRKQLLDLLKQPPVNEIEQLVADHDYDGIIAYPLSNPNLTLKDTARILLIKATVYANLLDQEAAENYYKRSMETFCYDDNILAYSKFIFTRRQWDACLKISLKAVPFVKDTHKMITLVNQLLRLYLEKNKNEDGIKLGTEFLTTTRVDNLNGIELIQLFLILGQHYRVHFNFNEARSFFNKAIDFNIDQDNDQRISLLKAEALVYLGDTYFDYRLTVKSFTYEDPNIAIEFYKKSQIILNGLSIDQDNDQFKYIALKLHIRLSSIYMGLSREQSLYSFNITKTIGSYFFKQHNELLLEYVGNERNGYLLELGNTYPSGETPYLNLISFKNITESKTDHVSRQNLFYIYSWLLGLNWIDGRSSVNDYYITLTATQFDECVSFSSNEFIYNGICFFKVVASHYQNRGSDISFKFHQKLIQWVEFLFQQYPDVFREDICNAYTNYGNDLAQNFKNDEASTEFNKATQCLNKIAQKNITYFKLKENIAFGLIAIDLNSNNFIGAKNALDKEAEEIVNFNFDENFAGQFDRGLLLKMLARQYSYCKEVQAALHYIQKALDVLFDCSDKYLLNEPLSSDSRSLKFELITLYYEAGTLLFGKGDIENGKKCMMVSLKYRKNIMEMHPRLRPMLIGEYCNRTLEFGMLLLKNKDAEYKDILTEAVKDAQEFENVSGHEWANELIKKASMLFMVEGMFDPNLTIGVNNFGDSFQHEQIVTGLSSIITSATIYMGGFQKDLPKAIDCLVEGINFFDSALTIKGKLLDYEYFFQMSFMLYRAYLNLDKVKEAEKVLENAYDFSKYILTVKANEDKQFVMICEHYCNVLTAALKKANFFTKNEVKGRIKDIYQDMVHSAKEYPLTNKEEIGYFNSLIDKMFALI